METITCGLIARRLGVSRWCAWQWSRKGRFGWPIDETAGIWRWEDDGVLGMMLSNCRPARTKSEHPANVWFNVERQCTRRLAAFADGTKPTDPEDKQLASLLMVVAARRHQRRAAGQKSPATTAAAMVFQKVLARGRAAESWVPDMLLSVASQLIARKGQ